MVQGGYLGAGARPNGPLTGGFRLLKGFASPVEKSMKKYRFSFTPFKKGMANLALLCLLPGAH